MDALFIILQFSFAIYYCYGKSRLLFEYYDRSRDASQRRDSNNNDNTFSNINALRGQTGTLRPNLAQIDSTGIIASNDLIEIPESIIKTRNFNKLLIAFDNECNNENNFNQIQNQTQIQVTY